MRYVVWIAFRESSNLWTHIALLWSMPVWESIVFISSFSWFSFIWELGEGEDLRFFLSPCLSKSVWGEECLQIDYLVRTTLKCLTFLDSFLYRKVCEWNRLVSHNAEYVWAEENSFMCWWYWVHNLWKGMRGASLSSLWTMVSNQVGRPAELKHINKRRKRN